MSIEENMLKMDLEKISVKTIKSLKKDDVVYYRGIKCIIETKPQKRKLVNGVWFVGLREADTGKKFVIKLVSKSKNSMTPYEKKVYKRNISAHVKRLENGEISEEKIIEMIQNYYHNMVELNKYSIEDVRECMSKFPGKLLKESGIKI